ncbi:MAG: hypothetical protein NT176_09065, partial [Proteobacteria bacterium]|nr:hypothetical protein [Pseudomonadota bacterium]
MAPKKKAMKMCAACGKRHSMSTKKCQCGGGIFSSIGDWFKGAANTVKNGVVDAANATYNKVLKPTYDKVLVPTHDFIKKHKVISKVLSALPMNEAKAGGLAANLLGYGKKRKSSKKMSGGSLPISATSKHMSFATLGNMVNGVRKQVLLGGGQKGIAAHLSMYSG